MFPLIDALIQDIVAGALGDVERRERAEDALQRMTAQGWKLAPAVWRLWDGERSPTVLFHGLDDQEQQILQDALDLLGMVEISEPDQPPAEVMVSLEGMPESVRMAIVAQDEAALQAALVELAPEQQQKLHAALTQWVSKDSAGQTAVEQADLLAHLPVDVRLAILDHDPQALQAALSRLPYEQAESLLAELLEAGLLEAEAYTTGQTVEDLAPVLHAVAALAQGDASLHDRAEDMLDYLESQGLQVSGAIRRIWAGERDAAALVEGLDEQGASIIREILAAL